MLRFLFKNKLETTSNQPVSKSIIVDTHEIEPLYAYIEQYSGIALQKSKVLVQNHIIILCERNNISSFGELLRKIKQDEILFKTLVDSVTIHETYFFREKGQLEEALTQHKNSPALSILSAPCSSGEEAFSIAILALEMGITNFQVVGIDISGSIIQKAKNSSYTKRSIKFLPKALLEKYFTNSNDTYIVKKELYKYVTFLQCNLFDDKIYQIGMFDIIFSRNMFIYFNDEKKIQAYKRLESLKKNLDASIYLGHADISSKLSQYIRNRN
ncbi:hypothetical protein JHD48_10050 [Sulfurimonas sp. SAG-AH-194-I05]|nr:CheR family methyltransferase [Sulfurimonas sp. SAG-AH-194-I05]MDF1876077.1 hypothetical protein [Sulfurimonas sp. SAG-AH-194-I05]